ncbi:MAG: hypothetical protein JW810_11535 [Sedimentisphaerales bacterium]|nr:hypothetical protein [Sedimentisphaerales bacterium]
MTAKQQDKSQEFADLSRQTRRSLIGEFWDFLKHNKKWWLLPIILVLLLLMFIVVVSGTLGPWVYPLL